MKYFISDVHLSDAVTGEEHARDDALIDLLARIDLDSDHGAELVLLGDTFDLYVTHTTNQSRPEAVIARIDTACDRHRRLLEAFNRFVRRGNRLFFVWGNHDHALRYRVYQVHLKHRILPHFWQCKYAERITFADYFAGSHLLLYAEHGHRFDVDNLHVGMENTSFGYEALRELIRKWEDVEISDNPSRFRFPFRFLDAVRPRSHAIRVLNHLVREGLVPQHMKSELVMDILGLYRRTKRPLPGFLINLFNTMPDSVKDSVFMAGMKDHTPKRLYDAARKLVHDGMGYEYAPRGRKAVISEFLDLDFIPRVILFGHSHYLERKEVAPGYWYINTGSWQPMVKVDADGEVERRFRLNPVIQVFPPGPAGRIPRPRIWDAESGRNIPSELFPESYREW